MTDTYIQLSGGPSSLNADGGFGLVLNGIATLNALQTTMAGVGSGDNSANVTTMATNMGTLSASVRGICGANPAATPGTDTQCAAVVVSVDTSKVKTVSALRAIFLGMLVDAGGKGMAA